MNWSLLLSDYPPDQCKEVDGYSDEESKDGLIDNFEMMNRGTGAAFALASMTPR